MNLGWKLAQVVKQSPEGSLDEPRRQLAAEMSGLSIHCDLGPGHPLLGRRMPDLDLVTAKGPLRVFTEPFQGARDD